MEKPINHQPSSLQMQAIKHPCHQTFAKDCFCDRLEDSTWKSSFVMMQLDILERKIKRLVNKLKRSNIHLEVFDSKDIEYGATIGKGGEGVVQCCTVQYNGLRVRAAVKTVLNNSDDSLNHTFDEIELLCLARDPIVTTTIQVYGVAAVPDDKDPGLGHLVIVTEAGIMNSLQLYQTEDIPLHVTYSMWSHLAAALHCIHRRKIIHQDLKPENILVTGLFRDAGGHLDKVQVKVIDLGMARLVEGDSVFTDDLLGTEGYHAPEVLFDDSYDFRADIFVLGITFCVLLFPKLSLKKTTLMALLKRIHEAKQRKFVGPGLFNHIICPMLTDINFISNDIKDMICQMLESVENRTITLLDIAWICQKESVGLRQQQLEMIQSGNSGRLYHLDSGIDSLENAVISDVITRKNTQYNTGHSSTELEKRSSETKPGQDLYTPRVNQPKRACCRRQTVQAVSSLSDSEEMNGNIQMHLTAASVPHGGKQNSLVSKDEPICRRTRSAKRMIDVMKNEEEEEEKESEKEIKRPTRIRMQLRSNS